MAHEHFFTHRILYKHPTSVKSKMQVHIHIHVYIYTYTYNIYSTHQDVVLCVQLPRGRGRLVVIGGGLSAAQLALRACSLGWSSVTMLSRAPLAVRPFDLLDCWVASLLSPCLSDEESAFYAADATERRELLREARPGGSLTAPVHIYVYRQIDRYRQICIQRERGVGVLRGRRYGEEGTVERGTTRRITYTTGAVTYVQIDTGIDRYTQIDRQIEIQIDRDIEIQRGYPRYRQIDRQMQIQIQIDIDRYRYRYISSARSTCWTAGWRPCSRRACPRRSRHSMRQTLRREGSC